jgi:transcriptional regulator with XRE-family HTH domain
MKTFSSFIKKLPAERRARIEANVQSKIAVFRLQQAREEAGVTQEELAARLHMSQPALSRFERRPNVTVSVLQRYVQALGGTLEVNVLLPKPGPSQRRKSVRRGCRTSARRIALVGA